MKNLKKKLLLFFLVLGFSSAQYFPIYQCPFSLTCQSDWRGDGCYIFCDSNSFPSRGVFNTTKIVTLAMWNINNIPVDALNGLEIDTLILNNIQTIGTNSFRGVRKLHELQIQTSNFRQFEQNSATHIANLLRSLKLHEISQSSFTNSLSELRRIRTLENLSLRQNGFESFDASSLDLRELRTLDFSEQNIQNDNLIIQIV